MVSFPRDSWVQLPACRKPDGTMSAPSMGMFNSAFTTGGAACTIKLVQSLTGSRSTTTCRSTSSVSRRWWARSVASRSARRRGRRAAERLKLHPGTQKLSGDEALAYVRARYGIGDGSDLSRIKRQQQFLAR